MSNNFGLFYKTLYMTDSLHAQMELEAFQKVKTQ